MNNSRRQLISSALKCATAATMPFSVEGMAGSKADFAGSELFVLSDGNLSLPPDLILPNSISETEKSAFLKANNLDVPRFEPDCNLALWRTDERLVIFDVGAGTNFMPTAGKLLEDIEDMGIDPLDVTDVVFTHAHPDHLWGLLDDFDELAFPNAAYYMNEVEWDYWNNDNTIDQLPDVRKAFAVGAKNRLVYLKENITLFKYGAEILPGIEAVDTHGHTPGHTSFALHQGTESVLVIGDAITHPIISFQKASWPSGSDQDSEAGRVTRLALLDRLVQDKMKIVGFHLPHPGLGFVERDGSAYRFVT